jgi:hypothetical protein
MADVVLDSPRLTLTGCACTGRGGPYNAIGRVATLKGAE